MSFFQKYAPNETTVNGLSGALTLAAGSNITITPSGNTLTIAASGSSGANTALSNLTTTAINQDLLYGTAGTDWTIRTANNGAGNSGRLILKSGTASGTRGAVQIKDDSIVLGDASTTTVTPANGGNLGSSSAPWLLNASTIDGIYLAAIRYEMAAGPKTLPDSTSVNGSIEGKDNTGFNVYTTSQAGNTGPLRFQTGNSSSFNSGDMSFRIGTAAGTQGAFKFLKAGAAPTPGDVWTCSNADGSGYWAAGGGGITWSTPVDANIVPDTDSAYTLGTDPKRFSDGFAYSFHISNLSSNTGDQLVISSNTGAVRFMSSSDAVELLPSVSTAPQLRLWAADGSAYSSFQSPGTLASNLTYVLPNSYGSNGQFLQTNGSGTLTWASVWATPVDASIVPDTANTYDLGASGEEFAHVYAGIIYGIGGCGTSSIDVTNSLLIDQNSVDVISWASRVLYDTSGNPFLDFSNPAYISLEQGHLKVPTTITAGGNTGDQTINTMAGTVNFAASATSITVTNSQCTTGTIVFAVVRTDDATAKIKNVVPSNGSFVINLDAAATAETSVGWMLLVS